MEILKIKMRVIKQIQKRNQIKQHLLQINIKLAQEAIKIQAINKTIFK
jgi:hypothetical protein